MAPAKSYQNIKLIIIYAVAIFIFALLLVFFSLNGKLFIDSYSLVAIGIISLLVVWHFGIKLPYIGLISMERLVQFHLLLTLPLFDVILINMFAGFIMPFINKNYRLDSYHVAFSKGLSNAAMNSIMMLVAGTLMQYLEIVPIDVLTFKIFMELMLVGVIIQFVNMSMIAIYQAIDNKNYKKFLSPILLLTDLIFIPIGILSALLYQHSDKSFFYLFALFTVLIMLSFNSMQLSSISKDQGFLKTKYQSNYFNVESVSKSMYQRIDDMFTFHGFYLGSYNPDLKVLDMYLNNQQNNCIPLSKQKLIEISQLNELKTDVIKVENKKNAIISSPFKNHDGTFAFICLQNNTNTPYSKADISIMEMFVQRHRMGLSYALTYKDLSEYKNSLEDLVKKRTHALELANKEKSKLVKKLKSQAQRDGLTGLYNRRKFDEALKQQISVPNEALHLAVLDIDFFKKVNDTYGHIIGDEVLIHLANILNTNSNESIESFRYGGEEFVLLFKDMNDGVIDYLQKLLVDVRDYDWNSIADNLSITVSIGLAGYPTIKIKNLFSHADQMLYQAKTNGRDQLVTNKS